MAEAKSEGTRSGSSTDAAKDEKPKGAARESKGSKSAGTTGRGARETVSSVRKGVASAIWLLAVLAALILAAGALLIALDFNRRNGVVSSVVHTADNLNFLGTLKRFDPSGRSAAAQHAALVKTVLVSWGICAVVYLVVGKILDRVVRP